MSEFVPNSETQTSEDVDGTQSKQIVDLKTELSTSKSSTGSLINASSGASPSKTTSSSQSTDSPSRQSTLLKPTRAFLASKQELEQQKGQVREEDDIWWSKRSVRSQHIEEAATKISTKHYDGVQSKLLSPTVASISSSKEKVKSSKDDSDSSPSKPVPARLDTYSQLLKPTQASLFATWAKHSPEKQTSPDVPKKKTPNKDVRDGNTNLQNVHSKLFSSTVSIEAKRRNNKKDTNEIQQKSNEQSQKQSNHNNNTTSERRVSDVSPRLLAMTKAMTNSKREKVVLDHDRRESGWCSSFAYDASNSNNNSSNSSSGHSSGHNSSGHGALESPGKNKTNNNNNSNSINNSTISSTNSVTDVTGVASTSNTPSDTSDLCDVNDHASDSAVPINVFSQVLDLTSPQKTRSLSFNSNSNNNNSNNNDNDNSDIITNNNNNSGDTNHIITDTSVIGNATIDENEIESW